MGIEGVFGVDVGGCFFMVLYFSDGVESDGCFFGIFWIVYFNDLVLWVFFYIEGFVNG